MHAGKYLFAQLMDFLPKRDFDRCVLRYKGNYRTRRFSCFDQFLSMAFAQLTYRDSLRDIETCLNSLKSKLYHAGIRGQVARNTLACANQNRDWRIYADFAQLLIARARTLYTKDPLTVDLAQTVYAFDSSTIDLCLTLFPWAHFRRRKAAIKLHTLIDLRGNIPCFVHISSGKMHDVKALDYLPLEAGAFSVMDPGRIKYVGPDTGKRLVFLTNNFLLDALTIAKLYKCRWQVELFFKWIKQHLRINAFYGTSENAVKTQVWIALSVYVLVAIVKKELNLERSMNDILQILSVNLFEKTPIFSALSRKTDPDLLEARRNQLTLFDF